MSCDCGCGPSTASPLTGLPVNRPWLSEIGYRPGSFASFRKALLNELARTPELSGLRSRVSDDYTVSAVEMWAAVADVLAFYLERIANDAFVRTAPTRDAVLRLVRLIDYHLAPGVAATTRLAFTLERGSEALIPARTRVQSVPGAGQTPQKYETLTALQADARLNRLRAMPAPVLVGATGSGTTSAVAAPDDQAIAAAGALAPGGKVVFFAPAAVEAQTIAGITTTDDLLRVSWVTPLSRNSFSAVSDESVPDVGAYRLGRTFRLFGHDAPRSVVVTQRTKPADPTTTYFLEVATDFSLHGDGSDADQIALDAAYADLEPGGRILAVASLAAGVTVAIPFQITTVAQRTMARSATPSGGAAVVTRSGTVTLLTLDKLSTRGLDKLLPSGDIRDVVIHELLGDALRFWSYAYPDMVTTRTVWVPGWRTGWRSIEVERTIAKGKYRPGTVLDLSDLAVGGQLVAADDGGTATAASVVTSSLAGSQVEFGPTSNDVSTVSQLGLDPTQSVAMTALVSGSHSAALFLAPPRELTAQIGDSPVMTLKLDPNLGPPHAGIGAAALQLALRQAAPESPAFANAVVTMTTDAFVVVPGVPGQEIRFGPSSTDSTTVFSMRLDPAQTRFLDGVLSGDVSGLVGTTVAGSVAMTLGANVSAGVSVNVAVNGTQRTPPLAVLANALAAAFKIKVLVSPDNRRLLVPAAVSPPRAALLVAGAALLRGATLPRCGNRLPPRQRRLRQSR